MDRSERLSERLKIEERLTSESQTLASRCKVAEEDRKLLQAEVYISIYLYI